MGEWVATITRLWDDSAAYAQASTAARSAAERQWHPDGLGPRWAAFLNTVVTSVSA